MPLDSKSLSRIAYDSNAQGQGLRVLGLGFSMEFMA